eukprot:c1260_g1_i1.p2 GENE.c1260_g1_i1~~c1260_g1_i1.p2  ORF type:complete len:130 (+),score=24.65 c1260_g1_i1:289-678(+)
MKIDEPKTPYAFYSAPIGDDDDDDSAQLNSSQTVGVSPVESMDLGSHARAIANALQHSKLPIAGASASLDDDGSALMDEGSDGEGSDEPEIDPVAAAAERKAFEERRKAHYRVVFQRRAEGDDDDDEDA